jgi:hypothetical protein
MWAGIVYGSLVERHADHIVLSGGARVFLEETVRCDFHLGTYLKVTYVEVDGRKVARGISPSDSFRALNAPV